MDCCLLPASVDKGGVGPICSPDTANYSARQECCRLHGGRVLDCPTGFRLTNGCGCSAATACTCSMINQDSPVHSLPFLPGNRGCRTHEARQVPRALPGLVLHPRRDRLPDLHLAVHRQVVTDQQ